MDWDAAIDRNRTALKRVLATLVAMAGLADADLPSPLLGGIEDGGTTRRRGEAETDEGASAPTMTRRLYRTVLRLLRPAEAAARRLVILVARDIVVTLSPQRLPRPKPKSIYVRDGVGTGIVLPKGYKKEARPPRPYSFSVTDPMRRISRIRRSPARGVPRLWIPGSGPRDPLPRPPSADDEVDATRLIQRIGALGRALDDLPTYAKRFARWHARSKARRIRRTWPLRTGRPPGQRGTRSRIPAHEVHDILEDIHGLAFWVLDSPDTS